MRRRITTSTFAAAGETPMNVRCLILTLIPLVVFLPSGCGDRSGSTAGRPHHVEQTGAESTGPTNRVEIPAVVRSNLGITFAPVERRHVSSTLRVPGRFELLPTARREYRMTMPGHVELLVDQYEQVEAGQPLFRYRSAQWTALLGEVAGAEQAIALSNAELRVAGAAVTEVRRRLEILQSRMEALRGAEIRRADLELQAAEFEASIERMEADRDLAAARLRSTEQMYEQARARAAAALNLAPDVFAEQAGESLSRSHPFDAVTVRAAARGIVESLAVTDGAYVEDPAVVTTIVDPELLRFRAAILQSETGRLSGVTEAWVVPPESPGFRASAPPRWSSEQGDALHVGARLMLGLEASPRQRTIELVALPHEHRPWMRPGVAAFLEIVLDGAVTGPGEPPGGPGGAGGPGGPGLAIPRSAVMKDGLRHVFFRRDPGDPNAAIRIEADLGPDDGRWVVIRSGLRLGDEVVVDGAYELMLATAQSGSAMRGGHFHPDGTWHADH
jgi:hypothetical protein